MPPSTTTTKSESTAKPYENAQSLINLALKNGMQYYKSGEGTGVYKGNRVVPMSSYSTNAYGGLNKLAGQNSGQNGLSGNLQAIIDQGGFNNYQTGALKNFQETANSEYDMNANPGFQGILAKAQNDARHQVGLSASAAGRYGSGIAQGAVAREVGNVTDRMLSSDFNNWQGRRDAANSSLFNAAQTGVSNMNDAFEGMQKPYTTRLGVGAAYEDLKKRQMDERYRKFNEADEAKWNEANRLMGFGNLTSNYSSSSGTSQAPGPNPFLTALGGVSTGVGILGGLF